MKNKKLEKGISKRFTGLFNVSKRTYDRCVAYNADIHQLLNLFESNEYTISEKKRSFYDSEICGNLSERMKDKLWTYYNIKNNESIKDIQNNPDALDEWKDLI